MGDQTFFKALNNVDLGQQLNSQEPSLHNSSSQIILNISKEEGLTKSADRSKVVGFESPNPLNASDDPRNAYTFRPFNVLSLVSPKTFRGRTKLEG